MISTLMELHLGGGLMLNDEVFVDLNHLKVLMGWQASAIQRIRQHRLKGA